jgi:hypothetical protein
MQDRSPHWPLGILVLWTLLLFTDLGLLLMMLVDQLYGLGAMVLTIALWLGIMVGIVPLPSGRRRGRAK